MRKSVWLSVTFLSLLSACRDQTSPQQPIPENKNQVSIQYTQHNVPHITAHTFHGLGYGVGYAQAEENMCTLAEQLLKLSGKKSAVFGPGEGQKNVLSDLAYTMIDFPAQASALLPKLPDSSRAILQGYADGFNRSLAERSSPQQYPSPCRGASWIKPIQLLDLLAYQLDLASLASTRNFLSAMAVAQPPGQKPLVSVAQATSQLSATIEGIGSNGWALGKEKTFEAQSSLLANPHFPWDGELRFFQQHLTIPGVLDVTGVSMIGMPAVLIGFNQHLGWTHTVSQSKRFTLYQLELDPTNPLRYRYGSGYKDLTAKNISISVLQADGSLQPLTTKLYSSHYGPMLDLSALSPALGWNTQSAVTLRDANHGNSRMLQQWLAMGMATSKEAFFQAFTDHHGIPWVNTLMIDKSGTASYMDGSQVPLLHPMAERYWSVASASPQLAPIWQDGAGNVLLPGSDPIFEWQFHPDAKTEGLMPFRLAPMVTRNDYVFNANSSHWLSNVAYPLEGYSLMYGPERTVRSPRTRYNAQLITNTAPESLAGPDGKFSFGELKQVFTHNGSLFGGELRQQLAARCDAYVQSHTLPTTIQLQDTCRTLQQWDGQYQQHSRGAHLMREFLAAFRYPGEMQLAPQLFATPFSAQDPVHTPSQLASTPGDAKSDAVLQALISASQRLQQAGIPLDAPLGSIQYLLKSAQAEAIPMAGGYSYEGLFNMTEQGPVSRSTADLGNVKTGTFRQDSPLSQLDEPAAPKKQAYRVNYGSSFVMALQFDSFGPKAEMMLSYSQSHDPESMFFTDQTRLFSEQQWRPIWFKTQDVEANTVRKVELQY